MDIITALAASGMRVRTESLDILANNIANSATPGYKADGESYDLYFGQNAWEGFNANRPAPGEMPLVRTSWTNYAQGTLLQTGSPGDLAISGPGFFVVQGETKPLYTRNGQFRVTKQGALQTIDGYAALGTDGKPIQLDPAQPFQVNSSGQVTQRGTAIATLQVVVPDVPSSFTKHTGAYFQLTDDGKTMPASDAEIRQGTSESSNVDPTEASVKLVSAMRQFEMMQKAIRTAAEMGKESVEQVAKLPS
jgi:flagellar basal-body rod protein FlgF